MQSKKNIPQIQYYMTNSIKYRDQSKKYSIHKGHINTLCKIPYNASYEYKILITLKIII